MKSYFGSATLPSVGKSSWLFTLGADFLPPRPLNLDDPLDTVTTGVSPVFCASQAVRIFQTFWEYLWQVLELKNK